MQYKEAMQQLQTIVRRVEGSEVDVDELADSVRRANALIVECRRKLRSAEDEVSKALDDLRAGDGGGGGGGGSLCVDPETGEILDEIDRMLPG